MKKLTRAERSKFFPMLVTSKPVSNLPSAHRKAQEAVNEGGGLS
jgi:hypothetical protein